MQPQAPPQAPREPADCGALGECTLLSGHRRRLYGFRAHSKEVKIHEAGIKGYRLILLAAGVKKLLLLGRKQRFETIRLVERYDMRCIYGINYDEAAARLVVT